MNILSKILLPVIATATIGLALSAALTYQMSVTTIEELTASSQKMAIANAIVELEAGIEFNIFNAISLAQTGLLQPYLTGTEKERLANKKSAQDRIINMRNTYYYIMIGIINANGKVVNHTESNFLAQDFSEKPFFKEAMMGKIAVGNPYKYKNMIVYAVASPIFDIKTNKIIGVVYNVSRLIDTMSKRMRLGEKGVILVAGSDGIVFLHKDQDKVLVKNLMEFSWGKEMLSSQSGEMVFSIDNEQKLAHYDTIPETGWLAVAIADATELKQPSTDIRTNIIMVSITILLCLTGIIYVYIKSIIQSLQKAVEYAKQVASGVIDKDLNIEDRDDGIIVNALDSIYSALYKLSTLASSNKAYNEQGNDNNLSDKSCLNYTNYFKSKDEIGSLYTALQVMVHSMRTMVQKSDAASKLKSEFLANMSHEIRTPLNAIIGMAYLYLEHDGDIAKKHDYVVKIQVAARSLLGIINNVLDVSKIEAGMFDLEHVPFNLKDTGRQIAVIHHETASNKNILLNFEYDSKLPDFFIGDAVRVGQVLNNLVGNSLKFTEKGYVQFSFTLLDNDTQNNDKYKILFKVKDTGPGISSDLMDILFQPFTQADASISRRFGGTGLGLTISNNIVSLMGGKLSVESEVGVGTSFSFILELEAVEQAQGALNAEFSNARINLTNKRILVAEDNDINQLLMEELLEATGAEIVIAENGKEAVELARTMNFDIILMDMQMPIMDGIQASIEIRKFASYDNLPIVAVTANAMKEDKELGFAAGLNDYLTKPIEPIQLMMVLKSWILKD